MISYRLATTEDNQQLIALTAATGMTGETALRIDRKPDFFKLLQLRGESKVFVAEEDQQIIGLLCVSVQQVYVGGRVYPLQYIGDFKVAPFSRNKGVGLQLCNELANYVVPHGADLAFLNVSKGNSKPFSFFKNRPHIPDFENIGIFNIHQFTGKKKSSVRQVHFIEATPVDEELVKFLHTHYSRYELGTVITKEKLEGCENFVIRDMDSNIIAAMCLVDTMPLKQNVVMQVSWKMKWLLRMINSFSKLTGISKMPLINEPVRMIYIKYLAVKNRDGKLVKSLINHARARVYEKAYSFASIGVHEKDPLNQCFKGLFKITFKSVGMLLSIKDNKALVEKVKRGIPFEDYSLV